MGDSRRGPSSTPQSRKIMVIADPTRESAAALQYALSHAVLEQDELILVHVENNGGSWKNAFSSFLRLPSSSSSSSTSGSSPGANNANANIANTVSSLASEIGQGEGNFLEQMKRICEIAQPKVRVQTECITMDGIKAAAILLHGDKLGVEVIIIGQRRTISSSLLGYSLSLSLSLSLICFLQQKLLQCFDHQDMCYIFFRSWVTASTPLHNNITN
ncbi:hypothetical protein F2Q70_00027096 [Brassica cretica]|uniref:UspA domain-containing protein n=1 Tax=Brassica cretica TaxID=69181 RepID=A0A8S9L2Y7_BRACR|nr:hypothetical protein F2Q70_00027096 [Brassica cretica]